MNISKELSLNQSTLEQGISQTEHAIPTGEKKKEHHSYNSTKVL